MGEDNCTSLFLKKKEKEEAYIQCVLCLELHHEACRKEELTDTVVHWSCGCGVEYEFDMDFDPDMT